ncbi:hypothetical protein KPH14_011610 [Odynerus spinipes]|uniref:Uncharacterized protein n=1 Tax=Odynerus spinipes TaxID=1348599 RepID=A0AAD9RGQ4_9HYME|nr:hypothetical protein KPH14_011610 [Odynerus spinipes]
MNRGNSEVEDLDPDVQDYNSEEDYNDVFDSTSNGIDKKISTYTKYHQVVIVGQSLHNKLCKCCNILVGISTTS